MYGRIPSTITYFLIPDDVLIVNFLSDLFVKQSKLAAF